MLSFCRSTLANLENHGKLLIVVTQRPSIAQPCVGGGPSWLQAMEEVRQLCLAEPWANPVKPASPSSEPSSEFQEGLRSFGAFRSRLQQVTGSGNI